MRRASLIHNLVLATLVAVILTTALALFASAPTVEHVLTVFAAIWVLAAMVVLKNARTRL